jgi:hypothetical protein
MLDLLFYSIAIEDNENAGQIHHEGVNTDNGSTNDRQGMFECTLTLQQDCG